MHIIAINKLHIIDIHSGNISWITEYVKDSIGLRT